MTFDTLEIRAMSLRAGDRLADEAGELEVAWTPRVGRLVEVYLRRVDRRTIQKSRAWGAHEPLTVKRARPAPENCPRCGLTNPPQAQRCDCGHDFVTRLMKRSHLVRGRTRFRRASGIGVTGAVLILGLIRGLAFLLTVLGK